MSLPDQSNDPPFYVFTLYISGMNPRSVHAVENLKKICESELKGRYLLKIIDLNRDPKQAKTGQILAVPTAMKDLPLPVRKVIGDLSDAKQVIIGLEIR